jgi:hypothetical protein
MPVLFRVTSIFDIFRTPSGESSDAPSVSVSVAGLATVACRTSRAPVVTVSEAGMVTVTCDLVDVANLLLEAGGNLLLESGGLLLLET